MDIKSSIDNLKTKKVTFTNTSTEFTGSYNDLENRITFSEDFEVSGVDNNNISLKNNSSLNIKNRDIIKNNIVSTNSKLPVIKTIKSYNKEQISYTNEKSYNIIEESNSFLNKDILITNEHFIVFCYEGKDEIDFDEKGKSTNTEYIINFNKDVEADILVIGGGGAGGYDRGSGGGAGGLIFHESYSLKTQPYIIRVGKGGNWVSNNNGERGENSYFESLPEPIAYGGGGGTKGGGTWNRSKQKLGNNGAKAVGVGGSGGGGGGMGMVSQGHLGSNFNSTNATGGGGAGSGGSGTHTTGDNVAHICNGGIGLDLSKYFGKNLGDDGWFAGGGGGSVHFDQYNGECSYSTSRGGKGGGGSAGRFRIKRGQDGMPNTGGGGGGGSNINQAQGGNGGSGIVIIKYYSSEKCHYFTDPFDLFNKEIKEPNRYGLYGFSSHSGYPISNIFNDYTRDSFKWYNDKLPYHTNDLIDKSGFWIKFEEPTIINNFINTASNDQESRDPIRIRIEASNDTDIDFTYDTNGQHMTQQDSGTWVVLCENIELCGYKGISRYHEYNNNSGTNFTNISAYHYYKFIILESLNDTEVQISLTRFFGPKTKSDVRYLDNKEVIYKEIDSNTYYVELHHDSSQNEQTEYEVQVDNNLSNCKILMIGGGGAGGCYDGGGGGAGGVLCTNEITLNQGTYNAKIGRGGEGRVGNNKGFRGYNTEFDNTIVNGGGGGGIWNNNSDTSLTSTTSIRGGSGGGGGGNNKQGGVKIEPDFQGTILTISNTTFYGNDGGIGTTDNNGGSASVWDATPGGGGGAGEDGYDGAYFNGINPYNAGCGGNGIKLDIVGYDKYYGGGGGGMGDNAFARGGIGGGGNAIRNIYKSAHKLNGTRGTGGGGGGGRNSSNYSGNGGSGIIIIKYTGLNHPKIYSPIREYPEVREFVNNIQFVDNICLNRTAYSGNISYGKGIYKINYSQEYDFKKTAINTARRTDINTLPHNVFNDSNLGAYWLENNYLYGEYNKNEYLVPGINGLEAYKGDWITIELPYGIYIDRFKIKQNSSSTNNSPKDFIFYGSNDNINWIELCNVQNASYSNNEYEVTATIAIVNTYKHFGLVVNKLQGGNTLYISDIYIYGQEEYPIKIFDNIELLNNIKEDGWRKVKYVSYLNNIYQLDDANLISNKYEGGSRNININNFYYEKYSNNEFTEYLFIRKNDIGGIITYKWLICDKKELLDRKATGLKWKKMGTDKPNYGREIENENLYNKLLQSILDFTLPEWSEFSINDLIGSDYIKVDDNYYSPNELDWTNVKIKKSSISDKPYYVNWQTYSSYIVDPINSLTSITIYKPIISIDNTKTINNDGTFSSSNSHILYIENNNEGITLVQNEGDSYVYIRNIIDYEYLASNTTNMENWKLVRWMPPFPKTDENNNKLPFGHPTRDALGWYENSVYGTTDDYEDPWSLHLGRTDQYLFTTGNMYYWGILEKEDLTRYLNNHDVKILKSSISDSTIQHNLSNIYNRPGTLSDPWISLKDHNSNFDNIWLYFADKWNGFHSNTDRFLYVFNEGSCIFIKTDDIIKPYEYEKIGGKGLILDIDAEHLKVWYDFNGDFKDKNPSNNKYDIEHSGSVSFDNNSVYGISAKFKRDELSNEYLRIDKNLDIYKLWNDNGITFSIWIYVDDYSSLPSWARIFEFSIDDRSEDRISLMRYTNQSKFEARIMTNNSEESIQFGYDELITNNHSPDWHHIVWTIDKFGIWNIYLNGKNQNIKKSRYYYNNSTRNVQMSEPLTNKHFNKLYIGKAAANNTENWFGNIDDFRIYDIVINYSDISSLYNIKYQNIKIEYNLSKEIIPIYSNPTKSWVDSNGYTCFVYEHDQTTKDHTIYNVYFEDNVDAYVLIVGGGGSGADSAGGGLVN